MGELGTIQNFGSAAKTAVHVYKHTHTLNNVVGCWRNLHKRVYSKRVWHAECLRRFWLQMWTNSTELQHLMTFLYLGDGDEGHETREQEFGMCLVCTASLKTILEVTHEMSAWLWRPPGGNQETLQPHEGGMMGLDKHSKSDLLVSLLESSKLTIFIFTKCLYPAKCSWQIILEKSTCSRNVFGLF